jgi:hypothetical protein
MSSLLNVLERSIPDEQEEKKEFQRYLMYDRAMTPDLASIFEILDKMDLELPKDFSTDNEEDDMEVYKTSLKIDITQIYYSFFMQKLDLQIWKKFMESKDFLLQDKVCQFLETYSIKIINDILSDENLLDFQKERKLRDECAVSIQYLNYRMRTTYYELLSFELNEWKFFAKFFETWKNQGFSEERMILVTRSWAYVTKSQYPEKYKTISNLTSQENVETLCFNGTENALDVMKKHFCFYTYRTDFDDVVLVPVARNDPLPIHSANSWAFTNSKSHFEGDIFYLGNSLPCFYYYIKNGEKVNANEELFEWHKKNIQTEDWIKALSFIKWKELDDPAKTFVLTNLKKLVADWQYYEFFISKVNELSILEILEKIHNVEGRINKRYPLALYHKSLHRALNFIDKKKLYQIDEGTLFFEYKSQDEDTKRQLDELSKVSFDFLIEQWTCILLEKRIPLCMTQKLANFRDLKGSNSDILYFLQQKDLTKLMNEEVVFQKYNPSFDNCRKWKTEEDKLLAFLKK